MKDREQLLKELHEEKQRTQIANIKEELDLYEHDQFTLTVLYLTLKKMRIEPAEPPQLVTR